MFQGNWVCSGCGAAITELPFEPRSDKGLTCRACHAKKRADEAAASTPEGENAAAVPTERPKVAGNWVCSGCGAAITSLPFTPRDTSNLLCIDCYRKK